VTGDAGPPGEAGDTGGTETMSVLEGARIGNWQVSATYFAFGP